MSSGPWNDLPSEPVQTPNIPMRRVHLPIHLFVQGVLVNGIYLFALWVLLLPFILVQPLWLTVIGCVIFGLSGLYAAFGLLVISKLFIFGVNVIDTRRSQ